MKESEIEKYLHQQVVKWGGWTYKFKSPGRAGVPDRIVLWPPDHVEFVEVKTAKGKISAAQWREIRRIRALGTLVYVLRSKADVDSYVGNA